MSPYEIKISLRELEGNQQEIEQYPDIALVEQVLSEVDVALESTLG